MLRELAWQVGFWLLLVCCGIASGVHHAERVTRRFR